MKEDINFLIERNSILNTNFFCDIVVVIALIIVACICVVRRQKLKEREYIKKIRLTMSFLFSTGMSAILCLSIIMPMIKHLKRTVDLKKDLKEMSVIKSIGIVDKMYSYEKGVNAVVIGNTHYYVAPNIGNMKENMEFEYEYLKNSHYIISFEVLSDEPIGKDAFVKDSTLCKFGYSGIQHVRYDTVDDLAYRYVMSYLKNTSDEQDYLDKESWEIYSYYISEKGWYRSNIYSLHSNKRAYIIIDKNGKPLYFWTSSMKVK